MKEIEKEGNREERKREGEREREGMIVKGKRE